MKKQNQKIIAEALKAYQNYFIYMDRDNGVYTKRQIEKKLTEINKTIKSLIEGKI